MTDATALLQSILSDPADDLPRLLYADHLDECGEGERAEFLYCKLCELHYNQKMPHYKDIPGFPGYRIGDDGSVWSRMIRCYVSGNGRKGVKYVVGEPCHTKQMKPCPQSGGYLGVQLWKDGKSYHKLVHRLVLEAFVGPCPDGMECRHFPDDDKSNCNLSNLSWATKKQNQADRVFHGTHSRGEKHGNATLTNEQAAEIRRRAANGEKKAVLAREFGVSRYVASRAALGKTYR